MNHIHISEWVKLEEWTCVPCGLKKKMKWVFGDERDRWCRDDPMCLFNPLHFPTHFSTSHAVRWDCVIEF